MSKTIDQQRADLQRQLRRIPGYGDDVVEYYRGEFIALCMGLVDAKSRLLGKTYEEALDTLDAWATEEKRRLNYNR